MHPTIEVDGFRSFLQKRLEATQAPNSPLLSQIAENSQESMTIGEFKCTFNPESVLDTLQSEVDRYLRTGDFLNGLALVATASSVSKINSNRTCFACLSQCPVYILPCEQVQHTICEKCAIGFSSSTQLGNSTLCLESCPLCCHFVNAQPWRTRVRPPTAGVRLLALDG
jgi:hypothetical protein